jgi:hypothetical protein
MVLTPSKVQNKASPESAENAPSYPCIKETHRAFKNNPKKRRVRFQAPADGVKDHGQGDTGKAANKKGSLKLDVYPTHYRTPGMEGPLPTCDEPM